MSVRDVASDLLAEHDALDAIVAPLPDDTWGAPTPSPGWSIADQIGHLTYFDGTAALAITDPDAFAASKDALFTSTDGGEALTLGPYRTMSPPELLAAWRENRRPPRRSGRHARRRRAGGVVRTVDGRQVVRDGAADGDMGARPGHRRHGRCRPTGDRPSPPRRPDRVHHPRLVLRQPRPRAA